VTVATDSADPKEGGASAVLTVAAGFTTGLVAYVGLGAPVDILGNWSAGLCIESSASLPAGTLQLVLDDTAGCGSPLETLDIGALSADT